MNIIVKKNNLILLNLNLDHYDLSDIIYGTDTIKEIAFFRYIETEQDMLLEKFYEKLKFIEEEKEENDIFIIELYYSDQLNFSFSGKIKKIFYNVQSYMERQHIKTQERIIIRFQEENEPILDLEDEFLICSQECPYYYETLNYCKKYKQELISCNQKHLICKKCYIECSNRFGQKITSQIYDTMKNDLIANILNEQKYF